MRKLTSVLLSTVLIFTICSAFTGCGSNTGYKSPVDAAKAVEKGTNIVGKTISVTASMDYEEIRGSDGLIYVYTTPSSDSNVCVCTNGTSGTDIKTGNKITLEVTETDNELKYSFI